MQWAYISTNFDGPEPVYQVAAGCLPLGENLTLLRVCQAHWSEPSDLGLSPDDVGLVVRAGSWQHRSRGIWSNVQRKLDARTKGSFTPIGLSRPTPLTAARETARPSLAASVDTEAAHV